MKTVLRIALPPLHALTARAPVAFALLDRERRILRAGELPLAELAGAVPARRVEAVLHPRDTVCTRVAVPPLAGARLQAAIDALVEPLTLSAPDTLAVAHGPREPDGQAAVAWADRAPLARAWRLLADAGLPPAALYPCSIVLPPDDADPQAPLSLPAGARWQQPSPLWSLALPTLRPPASGASRWRSPLAWSAAALLVWLAGLNLYAARLAAEAESLEQAMQRQVSQAFPDISVVVDPLKQAAQRRDALRAAQGAASESDFVPLALAAARILPADGLRIAALRYQDGSLELELDDAGGPDAEAPDAQPVQQAAAQGLSLERTDTGWRIAAVQAGSASPNADAPARITLSRGGQP